MIAVPASDPITLTSDITDTVGALPGPQLLVQDALDRLADETEYRLSVVYVDDFGGMSPQSWTTASAQQSALGDTDLVLAIAVEGGEHWLYPDSVPGLSSSQLDSVASAAEYRLSSNNWGGAAMAAADSIRYAATDSTRSAAADPIPSEATSGSSGGSATGLLFIGGLVVIAAITGAAWRSSRRRAGKTAAGRGRANASAAGGLPPELAALSTAELDGRSAAALVRVDDALHTSEQELGFAQAQFGPERTGEFEQVIARAKDQITEAFRLRQTLDDAEAGTEPQIRETAVRILYTVGQVSEALDAQAEAFDRLRKVESRAGETLDALDRSAATLRERIEVARTTLATLGARYPADALLSVAGNPGLAADLLGEVDGALARGRQAVTDGDRGLAVRYARATEEALDQVTTLLNAVDRAGEELATTGARLDAALASISSDVEDAQLLAPQRPEVVARAQEARAAIAQGQAARGGQGDPLLALHTLTQAEADIDTALAPMRSAEDRQLRAKRLLDQNLDELTSAIRATTDYIGTRRDAIGPEPRTRLREAGRLFTKAAWKQSSDPEGALATAQRAQGLVREAQVLAQRDVERYDQLRRVGGGGTA